MKTLVFLACLVSMSVSANQQPWKIAEVASKEKVGYIYHTSGIGSEFATKLEKVHTSLRIVCSSNPNTAPIITLYWHNMAGVSENKIQVTLTDGKEKSIFNDTWSQDGPLHIRTTDESKNIIEKMKSSKYIRFDWNSGTIKRATMFDLQDFKTHLSKLNSLCNSHF